MSINTVIDKEPFILTEAAVIEALSHDTTIPLHPQLDHSLLIYDEKGRDALARLYTAIEHIDSETRQHPPTGYFVNCAYPSFLHPEKLSAFALKRLKGFQGNASSKNHSELDRSSISHSDNVEDWGDRMIALNRSYGIQILGGCCGTRVQHLEYIVNGIGL